ncbi:hypothetical protein BDQ17DRAFT_1333777 [Cyathus striatus]|nr:hypothetical protein BDQ17DRAFT_1333777 [Cyathus striatus]
MENEKRRDATTDEGRKKLKKDKSANKNDRTKKNTNYSDTLLRRPSHILPTHNIPSQHTRENLQEGVLMRREEKEEKKKARGKGKGGEESESGPRNNVPSPTVPSTFAFKDAVLLCEMEDFVPPLAGGRERAERPMARRSDIVWRWWSIVRGESIGQGSGIRQYATSIEKCKESSTSRVRLKHG